MNETRQKIESMVASNHNKSTYMLKVQIDNDSENDLMFTGFKEMYDLIEFVRTFEKRCNTKCEYSIADSEIYE